MRASLVRQVIFLLGLAFVPAIGQAIYFRNATSWTQPPVDSGLVALAEVQTWGDRVLWVDARPDEQFARAHVPGAVQLHEDRWDELLREMLAVWGPERKIVVYCSTQSCNLSHEVAERLRKEAGLTNVHVLQGGWEEWEKSQR